MIKSLAAVVTLCGSLLAPADAFVTVEKVSPWAIQCEADATYCQVAQSITLDDDPGHQWLHVGIYREGPDLVLVILTPPLTRPVAHLTLDARVARHPSADACDADRCVFAQQFFPAERKRWFNSNTLTVDVEPRVGAPFKYTFDLTNLETALKKLPVEL